METQNKKFRDACSRGHFEKAQSIIATVLQYRPKHLMPMIMSE